MSGEKRLDSMRYYRAAASMNARSRRRDSDAPCLIEEGLSILRIDILVADRQGGPYVAREYLTLESVLCVASANVWSVSTVQPVDSITMEA
jgi:hypothetical protein